MNLLSASCCSKINILSLVEFETVVGCGVEDLSKLDRWSSA